MIKCFGSNLTKTERLCLSVCLCVCVFYAFVARNISMYLQVDNIVLYTSGS